MDKLPFTVSLTGSWKAFVEDRVNAGGFASSDAYIQNLLQAEYQRLRDQLKADLQLGMDELDKGEGLPGEQSFQEIRERIHRHSTAAQ